MGPRVILFTLLKNNCDIAFFPVTRELHLTAMTFQYDEEQLATTSARSFRILGYMSSCPIDLYVLGFIRWS